MSKMRIRLKIDAESEFDGGYYREMSPAEIENALRRTIGSMSILIREGASTPRDIPAKIKLHSIIYEVAD